MKYTDLKPGDLCSIDVDIDYIRSTKHLSDNDRGQTTLLFVQREHVPGSEHGDRYWFYIPEYGLGWRYDDTCEFECRLSLLESIESCVD